MQIVMGVGFSCRSASLWQLVERMGRKGRRAVCERLVLHNSVPVHNAGGPGFYRTNTKWQAVNGPRPHKLLT